MSQSAPKIYLATPALFELAGFAATLGEILDKFEVACVRLALATTDENELIRAADLLRETCTPHDVALVIDKHYRLAKQLGLDGVHLTQGTRNVREARKLLGADAIVGAFCGVSRHVGMSAGEMGADYVTFGPVKETGLGDGQIAELELFQWWSEMIEIPVIAEGGLDEEQIRALREYTDFICLGDEIWKHPDGPAKAFDSVLNTLS